MEAGQFLPQIRPVDVDLSRMIEIFGFVTGVVNVWLLARQNIWNWPIGIANNLAYLLLFAKSGTLWRRRSADRLHHARNLWLADLVAARNGASAGC